MEIIALTSENRRSVDQYIVEEWGGPMMVTLGNLFDSRELPGLACMDEGRIAGAILYRMDGEECEVAALYSLSENRGIGTALLSEVIRIAKEQGCCRVWLVTTNDNTRAIRYYQRLGFALKAVHIGSLDLTRKLKPGLPERGIDDIPLAHEFEFELLLGES